MEVPQKLKMMQQCRDILKGKRKQQVHKLDSRIEPTAQDRSSTQCLAVTELGGNPEKRGNMYTYGGHFAVQQKLTTL